MKTTYLDIDPDTVGVSEPITIAIDDSTGAAAELAFREPMSDVPAARFIDTSTTYVSAAHTARTWPDPAADARREREAWNRAVEDKKAAKRVRKINQKWKGRPC